MTRDMELYVHIPFCIKKCDYCDFLSGPAGEEAKEAYVQALIREILASSIKNTSVSSVFVGGGTPSVLKPGQMKRIFSALREAFVLSGDGEITLEANPGTLDEEKLEAYRSCGVNRLSIGLQSPKDRELALLGRIHSFEEFLESYGLARKAGFDNINIDLMSAIPFQTREGWEENLRTAAALGPEHISAYSLIVEEGTPFAQRSLSLPDEDTEYRMYEDTARLLGEYGYRQYEISNYAQPGRECRHNVGYWKRVPYLGLGLGAASLMDEVRFSNTRSMEKYIKCSSEPDFPRLIRENKTILSAEEQMGEFMFLGLRRTKGVSLRAFEEAFGISMEEIYGSVIKKYKALSLLAEEGGRIFLTREGIHVSNTVMADFLL